MVTINILLKAYRLMCTASAMARVYDENRSTCKYVHSTSRGHEAIQLATALHLVPADFISPYYRDDSILLGIGYEPYELMLQLLAKADDPFSGGRSYYAHPSNKEPDKPGIIHQSSATGMQVIPTTGIAQGLKYLEIIGSPKVRRGAGGEAPVVVCSLGDGSVTEGEVSEAFQFAVLKKLPVIYLVQDNNWGISASSKETRVMDAYEYTSGFAGMHRVKVNGSDFRESYELMGEVIAKVRRHREPYLVHATVPLLGHHTSGVRKEFYRSEEDLAAHASNDPLIKLKKLLMQEQVSEDQLLAIEQEALEKVRLDFSRASNAKDPDPASVSEHVFAPTPVTEEKGVRQPEGATKVLMVDAALIAIREIMEEHPEAILFGQDVGRRLGGVFREAATLADLFGDHRVFNTAIQEAYIIGSTAGLSAVGVKPIVEVQFADYLYPGLNQLVCEIAKSNYLTNGKYPVQTLVRVPVGAYGGGGPYHSGCIETTLLSIKGLKIVYPSNAADMKGLLKAAFYDLNPVIMLEHKGLYWGKITGTEDAKTPEPSRDYIIPLGKARVVMQAEPAFVQGGESCAIITYGMGVYWAKTAATAFKGKLEIIDLRTLYPLDEALVFEAVQRHGKCLVLTEEQQENSFAEALAFRIMNNCFQFLDAPVQVLGALNNPAVPINTGLEKAMLPDGEKVVKALTALFNF
jgi:2-oxoisovalerate dehydrogenase E1 component